MSHVADLIRGEEGIRLNAYRDQGGVWTIGYGHTGPDVHKGLTITTARAEEMLHEDLAWVRATIQETVKVPLSAGQSAAISSLIFNIGGPKWRESTALKRLNAGDYHGAADAMTWFRKSRIDGVLAVNPVLVRRRERERALFLSDMTGGAGEMPQAVEGGEAKPMTQSKTLWLALFGQGGLGAALIGAITQADWRVAVPLIVVGGVLAGIVLNRWLESRKGEH